MAKFSFRKPRIISKKFPEMISHIDGVTKSLEGLVFSYADKVDKTLQKKYLMLAISSIVLLVVLGSFISPKGKADSSIFYPESCLGGWINPPHAQGEPQTTSNGDEAQFTKDNSAILPKNTNAEMYCGNFKGTFDAATHPTKILVSLALTKGADIALETIATGTEIVASSSSDLSAASSTTIIDPLILASTTSSGEATTTVTSSLVTATTSDTTASTTILDASSTVPVVIASSTPIVSPEEPRSIIGNVIESVKDSILNLFNTSTPAAQETDTVIVPPPAPIVEPVPVSAPASEPTSLLLYIKNQMMSLLATRVFAEEVATSSEVFGTSTPSIVPTSKSISDILTESTTSVSTTTLLEGTSTPGISDASSTEIVSATSTPQDIYLDNFLEVLYTFDGVTWISLGDLNEISMKYRTFEIPVATTTSWSDMGQLQIKIQAKRHLDETPTVYLDGIKVEVLYETSVAHTHPDFARDTILKDEILDGVRVVTIINNDTLQQEVWYMNLDVFNSIGTTTEVLVVSTTSLTDALSTSTQDLIVGSSSQEGKIDTHSSSTVIVGTSTNATSTALDLLKRSWKKYEGKDMTLATQAIVEEIKKQEVEEIIKKIEETNALPDFASDTIKRMKGTSVREVIVQIQKIVNGVIHNELWLYDTETGTQEKIGSTASTTIAEDSPLGIKDGYVFWLSDNKSSAYAYRPQDKMLLEQPVKTFDPAYGERAELQFEGVPWKVIVSNEGFTFYSDATGEVFSDEDSRIVGVLRSKMGLDAVLDKEQLSNLNLPVEPDTPVAEQ